MYFRNYRPSRTWLNNSLKSTVSEHPPTVSMLNVPKHLPNVHDSTFIIFYHHSQEKRFGKYFLYCRLKSYGCLLTHGAPITSILFRIVRICCSLFRCIYLKNKKYFLGFLSPLWNLHEISNIFKKKKIVIADVFPELTTV